MSATDPARITTPERTSEDADAALRPKSLDEFVGQQTARENLRVFVNAARSRGAACGAACGAEPGAVVDGMGGGWTGGRARRDRRSVSDP